MFNVLSANMQTSLLRRLYVTDAAKNDLPYLLGLFNKYGVTVEYTENSVFSPVNDRVGASFVYSKDKISIFVLDPNDKKKAIKAIS